MASVQAEAVSLNPASSRTSGNAWWMLAVLFAFYTIAFIDRLALTVMVEPIKADLKLSDFQISLLLGPAFGVFYAVCGIPLGVAADHFERRWVIFCGMLIWSIATVASGLARSFNALLVVRALMALGEAALVPAAYSLLADAFEKRRLTTAMAIFTGGYKAGVAASFTLAALALSAAARLRNARGSLAGLSDWQAGLLMLGVPGLLLSFLAFTFHEPERRGGVRQRASRDSLWPYLRQRADITIPLAIAVTVLSVASSSVTSWAPAFMSRQYHWAPLHYAPALSLISLLSVGAVVIKGGVMDWLFARGMRDAHVRFYIWVLLAGLPICTAAFLLPWPWIFLPALGVVQAVVLPFMVYFIATIQLAGPARLRGQLTALYFGIGALSGSAFGPPAVGALNEFVFHDPAKVGWSLTIVLVASLLIALVSLRFLLPKLRPAIEEQEAVEHALVP